MAWPDIFFPKKRPAATDASAPDAPAQPPDVPKIVAPPADAAPAAVAPAPTAPSSPGTVALPPRPASQPLPPPRFPASNISERSTRTLPVVHGVILRPPTRPTTGPLPTPSAPPEPIKNIEQLMTEADPVKTLSQTGNIRMLKVLTPDARPVRTATTPPPIRAEEILDTPPAAPAPEVPAPIAAAPPAPVPARVVTAPPMIIPPQATESSSPWPSFPSKPYVSVAEARVTPTDALPPLIIRKAEPIKPTAEAIKIERPATGALPQPKPIARESTLLARPGIIGPSAPASRIPPPLPPMIQIGSIVRRKAKLADVARIVLPPKREETGPLPATPPSTMRTSPKPLPRVTLQQMLANSGQESPFLERSALAKTSPLPMPVTVSPAQTTVLTPITLRDKTVPIPNLQEPAPTPALVEPRDKTVPIPELQRRAEAVQLPLPVEAKAAKPLPAAPEPVKPPPRARVYIEPPPVLLPISAPVEAKAPEPRPVIAPPVEAPKPEPAPAPLPPLAPFVPKIDFAAPVLDSTLVFDPRTMPVIPPPAPAPVEPPPPAPAPAFVPALAETAAVAAAAGLAFVSVPQVDSEAHKATAPDAQPKLDPEAHKISPVPAPAEPEPPAAELAPAPGTREFHLTNGERVAGIVLSETPETIYVQHPSLGVLTVPRDEIATRLAEIILINGDRIVGNIMAETNDMLYVRHASLGMLSVPKAQRSTRVVEAILKNGDRVLGEVMTETETFTVIKSAALGTVTVPHANVSMLNRKIEQIEMKTLPLPPAPQLMDKK